VAWAYVPLGPAPGPGLRAWAWAAWAAWAAAWAAGLGCLGLPPVALERCPLGCLGLGTQTGPPLGCPWAGLCWPVAGLRAWAWVIGCPLGRLPLWGCLGGPGPVPPGLPAPWAWAGLGLPLDAKQARPPVGNGPVGL
jgi:hypothetical protein